MSKLIVGVSATVGAIGVAYALAQRFQLFSHNQKKLTGTATTATNAESTIAPTTASASASSSSSTSTLLCGSSASAASKVLITGGYLILESAYPGLVLSLSARFHTNILALTPEAAARLRVTHITSSSPSSSSIPLLVYAPQRSSHPLRYLLSWSTAGEQWSLQKAVEEQESNKFVELTILYTLLYLSQSTSFKQITDRLPQSGLLFYLEGDFPFYSAVEPERLATGVPQVVPDGSKTGLGSSAALVSSMVAAMFTYFHVAGQNANDHNLAQFIHCAAQGKVGSGFDVSTAFYGSQIYQRFDKSLIQSLVEAASRTAEVVPMTTSIPPKDLLAKIDAKWDNSVKKFALPPGLVVILADVAGGASTPVMVKKVLEWRTKPESDKIWTRLAEANKRVESLLIELSALAAVDPKAYNTTRLKLSQLPAHQWDLNDTNLIGLKFKKLNSEFYYVRQGLRDMGQAAEVDIEPVGQGVLLDKTYLQPGVLFAGVPGAGGDDAIFAILMDGSVEPTVEQVWTTHAFTDAARQVRRLPVHEEMDNIQTQQQSQMDISRWQF